VHALFQNIGTQATKRYFLPRLGRVAYFSRYKVGLRNETQHNQQLRQETQHNQQLRQETQHNQQLLF
ncbi:MAG: hypothetical protein EWV83_12295, partial [Microcystis sp. M_OC_Ca_00000000_S217Cul]